MHELVHELMHEHVKCCLDSRFERSGQKQKSRSQREGFLLQRELRLGRRHFGFARVRQLPGHGLVQLRRQGGMFWLKNKAGEPIQSVPAQVNSISCMPPRLGGVFWLKHKAGEPIQSVPAQANSINCMPPRLRGSGLGLHCSIGQLADRGWRALSQSLRL